MRFDQLDDLALETLALWAMDPQLRKDSPELALWLATSGDQESRRRSAAADTPAEDVPLPNVDGGALNRAAMAAARLCVACEMTPARTKRERVAREQLLELTAALAEGLVAWWRSRQETAH